MPGLHIDEVGGGSSIYSDVYLEGDYLEIKSLVENNKLIPGNKYLIKDYLHKYLLNDSDSSGISESSRVTKTPYNYYIYFESGVVLPKNAKVVLEALPDGYAGSAYVGMIGSVAIGYGDGGHRITGIPPIVNSIISYSSPRFGNPYIDGKVIRERFNTVQTGTLTTVVNSNIITGTETLFTQEFGVGETISYFVDAGYRYDHIITAINSDIEILIGSNVLAGDIATDAAIEKITFGKVLIQPGGLVNTEVHNGEAYSGMSALENMSPKVERLVLTAISPNKFSTTALSDTYKGDVVEYDFFDNEVLDLQGKVRDSRKGLIYYRKNEALKIEVNQDWRVQRFRRFRCDDNQWNRFRNLESVYKLDSGIVYQVGGISSLSWLENKRYLYSGIKTGLQVVDFTVQGTEENVFTNGKVFSPKSEDNGVLYNTYYDALNAMFYSEYDGTYNKFQYNLSLNFNEIKCKDYFIIPLDSESKPKELVDQFKVGNLQNSIFFDENKGQGISSNIDVVAKEIRKSTALTGGFIRSVNEAIFGFISVEDFIIENTGKITNLINFSQLKLKNAGEIAYCQIGGAWSYPIPFVGRATFVVSSNSLMLCTMLGVGTTDAAPNFISDTVCKDVLLKYYTLSQNTLRFRGAFFSVANTNDSDYGGNTWFQRSATQNCILNITPGFNRLEGIEYVLEESFQDLTINTEPITKQLYYEKIVEGKNVVEILSTPLKRTDTAVNIAVDNDTPIVGNNVVFTIIATHVSANPATNAIVNALLPDGYTFVSSDSINYDNVTGEWNVGDLATGTSKILNITAAVKDTGNYDLAVDLTTKEVEITPLDNTDNATTIPIASVNDLATTIAVDNAAPVIGSNVVFTITGNNNGNQPATNVKATSLLPAGYTYVNDDSGANYDPATGIWTIGSLAIAARDVINITATVEAAGSYKVDVSIAGSEVEDLPEDNSATITPVPKA